MAAMRPPARKIPNIFPQHLSINRGMMVVRDWESANEHLRGCDVCVHIGLNYASPGDLRPSDLSYALMVSGRPDRDSSMALTITGDGSTNPGNVKVIREAPLSAARR